MLPKSVEIVPVYDRSNLIKAAIETLKRTKKNLRKNIPAIGISA